MLRFSENRRSTGLSATTNPRTTLSAHGLIEATQVQAEGGAITGRFMSPLRTAEAILYQVPGIITSQVLAYNLGQFAATTSAQLRGVVSDETGSGALVFGTSPTLSGATLAGTTNLTGGQIAFPATQSASADPNTLDDYEEGSWTPTITFGTPGDLSVAYSSQLAAYTKIGRLIIADFAVVTSSFTHSTASGGLIINGFPFTSNASRSFRGTMLWQGITKANYTHVVPTTIGGDTRIELRGSGSAQSFAQITTADVPSGGSLNFTGSFICFE